MQVMSPQTGGSIQFPAKMRALYKKIEVDLFCAFCLDLFAETNNHNYCGDSSDCGGQGCDS
jgi:hypothetical protein